MNLFYVHHNSIRYGFLDRNLLQALKQEDTYIFSSVKLQLKQSIAEKRFIRGLPESVKMMKVTTF